MGGSNPPKLWLQVSFEFFAHDLSHFPQLLPPTNNQLLDVLVVSATNSNHLPFGSLEIKPNGSPAKHTPKWIQEFKLLRQIEPLNAKAG